MLSGARTGLSASVIARALLLTAPTIEWHGITCANAGQVVSRQHECTGAASEAALLRALVARGDDSIYRITKDVRHGGKALSVHPSIETNDAYKTSSLAGWGAVSKTVHNAILLLQNFVADLRTILR